MIRKVAFGKAALGGVAGATAWEAVSRTLITLHQPVSDVTRALGTLVTSSAWLWWPIGFAMHVLVGVIWAIFYAYFFWATYDRPPWLQGLTFSFIPTLLAGVVMIPELGAMHEQAYGVFGWRVLGWVGPVGVVVDHAIYGVVLGAIYTHPVGQRVRARRLAHA